MYYFPSQLINHNEENICIFVLHEGSIFSEQTEQWIILRQQLWWFMHQYRKNNLIISDLSQTEIKHLNKKLFVHFITLKAIHNETHMLG